MYKSPINLNLTEHDLEAIKQIAEGIKSNDLVFIRDDAMRCWMADFSKQGDKVAKAWVMGTLAYLSNRYEIKKKSE